MFSLKEREDSKKIFIKYSEDCKFIQRKDVDYEFNKYPFKKTRESKLCFIKKKKYRFDNCWLSITYLENKLTIYGGKFFGLEILYKDNDIKFLDFFYNDVEYPDDIKLIDFIKEKIGKDYTCLFAFKFLKFYNSPYSMCGIDRANGIVIVYNKFVFKKLYDEKKGVFRYFDGELKHEAETLLVNGAINIQTKGKMVERSVIQYLPESKESIYLKNYLVKSSSPYKTLIYLLDKMDMYYGYLFFGKDFNSIELLVKNKEKPSDEYINNQHEFIRLNFKNVLQTVFRMPGYSNEEYNPFFKIGYLLDFDFNKARTNKTINYVTKSDTHVYTIIQTSEFGFTKYVVRHFKKYMISSEKNGQFKFNLEKIDFHEYYEDELVNSYGLNFRLGLTNNFNITRKIYGYKLGLSKMGFPCIIKLEIPFDAFVVGSNDFKSFRCSKAIVRSILQVEKSDKLLLQDKKILKDKCQLCLTNYCDKMFLCKHKMCAYCCDKVLEEFGTCEFCQKSDKNPKLHDIHIKYSTEFNKAYSYINYRTPIEYKKDHIIHASYFDKKVSRPISNGIHFYLNPKYVEDWYEIENIPKELRKFNHFTDFLEPNEIESELRQALLNIGKGNKKTTDEQNFELSIS